MARYCYHTSGLPQSHCSSFSRMPFPQMASVMILSGEGGFFKHIPPPFKISLSKFLSLQLLNLVDPLLSHQDTQQQEMRGLYLTVSVCVLCQHKALVSVQANVTHAVYTNLILILCTYLSLVVVWACFSGRIVKEGTKKSCYVMEFQVRKNFTKHLYESWGVYRAVRMHETQLYHYFKII